MAATEKLQT